MQMAYAYYELVCILAREIVRESSTRRKKNYY
jgi:hypothetical protein